MTWPRDEFARAVWDSDLPTAPRIVALAYADHAGQDDFAWVDYGRMMQRTGLSRDTVNRARRQLVEEGWLVLKTPARQRYSARYWLRDPAQSSDEQTTGPAQAYDHQTPGSQSSDGRTAQSSDEQTPGSQSSDGASQSSDGASQSSDHQTRSPILITHPEGESDDARGSSDQAEAVASIVARFGPAFSEDDAIAAVAKIAAWARKKQDPIRDMVAFTATRSLEDLQRWAGSATSQRESDPPRARRCPSGAIVAADGACCAECDTSRGREAS